MDAPCAQVLPSTQRGMRRSSAASRRHAAATAPGELDAHGRSGARRAAMRVDTTGAEHIPTPVAVRRAFDVRATYEELRAYGPGVKPFTAVAPNVASASSSKTPPIAPRRSTAAILDRNVDGASPPCVGQGWLV